MKSLKKQSYFHYVNIALGIVFIASGIKGIYVNMINNFFVALGIIIVIYNVYLIYKSRK